MATLLLADKGQISLEDEISRHLPDRPDSAAGITVKHLIRHTSGLRSDLVLLLMAGWRLEDVITNDDVIRLFKRHKNLKFSPGERFCYSGTGYLLLASMIEHVSGQSLSMFCGEQIFKPLGMECTHFHDDYLKIVKNRAYAYCRSMEGSYSRAVLSCGLVGGTGLFTTIENLVRWDENFYSGVVGGPSVIRQMHQPSLLKSGEKVDYACGLVIEEFQGKEVVSHGGDRAGIHCYMMRFPGEQFTAVVLSNCDAIKARQLAQQTSRLYWGNNPALSSVQENIQPAVDLPSEGMQERVGNYYDDASGTTVDVELVDGKLRILGHVLIPESEDSFIFADTPEAKARFSPISEVEQGRLLIDSGLNILNFQYVEAFEAKPAYLNEFAGRYYSSKLDRLWTISAEEKYLNIDRSKRGTSLAGPITPDAFSDNWMAPIIHVDSRPQTLAFERDQDGAVTGFRASDGGSGVNNLRFSKQK